MKIKIGLQVLVILGITAFTLNGYGQEIERANKQKQQSFYRATLQLDSTKADQVLHIQDSYKASLKLVMADTTLTDETRRNKIRLLMNTKNSQLRKLLTPIQQQKIIPPDEQKSGIVENN